MAKKFGGFTPQQQHTLLSKMGYTGPAQQDDLNKFMMSSPKAASMMGKYAGMAKARVEGGPQVAMHKGGYEYGGYVDNQNSTMDYQNKTMESFGPEVMLEERQQDDVVAVPDLRTYGQGDATTSGTPKQNLTAAKEALATQKEAMNDLAKQLAGMDADDPGREALEESIKGQQVKLTQASADYDLATKNYSC